MSDSEAQPQPPGHGYGGSIRWRRYLIVLTVIAILPLAILVAARDAVGVMAFDWLTDDRDYLAAISKLRPGLSDPAYAAR